MRTIRLVISMAMVMAILPAAGVAAAGPPDHAKASDRARHVTSSSPTSEAHRIPAVAAANAKASSAIAAGNDTTDRPDGPDTWSNFIIIDTNNPVSADGYLTEWSFYAKSGRSATSIQLKVYRETLDGFEVIGISDVVDAVEPNAVNAFELASPIPVLEGDVIGMWVSGQGWVPYSVEGTSFYSNDPAPGAAKFTANGSGSGAAVGQIEDIAHSGDRVYSLAAAGVSARLGNSWSQKVTGGGEFTAGGTGFSLAVSASDVGGQIQYSRPGVSFHATAECLFVSEDGMTAVTAGPAWGQDGFDVAEGTWAKIEIREGGDRADRVRVRLLAVEPPEGWCAPSGSFPGVATDADFTIRTR